MVPSTTTLAVVTNDEGIPTMSSVDLAKFTGKRHDHVMRDIKVVLTEAGIMFPRFGGAYLDVQKKSRPCFFLPQRECLLLMAGYSAKIRLGIIDRWQELETEKTRFGAIVTSLHPALALIDGLTARGITPSRAGDLAVKLMGAKGPEKKKAAAPQADSRMEDVVGRFLAQRTQPNPESVIRTAELYRRFTEWCADTQCPVNVTTRRFSQEIRSRGYLICAETNPRIVGLRYNP